MLPNALPNCIVLFGMKFLIKERLLNIDNKKLIATNANAADSINGNTSPNMSNITIKLIGIQWLIGGREIVRDKFFFKSSG